MMKTLSQTAWHKAQQFLMRYGRPLDQARFRFFFENGTKEDVLVELVKFQNADGGFGHALEPDLRTPASSAIATLQAFAFLRVLDIGGEEPVVRRAVEYLHNTYDAEREVWPIVPPAVEDAPHAPWWTYADTERNFAGFRANPTASLLGALWDYPQLTPVQQLLKMTETVMARLVAAPDTMEMHDLQCYISFAEARHLPADVRRTAQDKLRRIAQATVEYKPEAWANYGLQPLDVASSPGAFLADAIERELIEANLDYLIDQQLPDGSWPLSWNWSFVDEHAWAQAELDWKGQQIVNKLRILQAYSRVEG